MMINIREAQESDLPELYEVYHACGKADVGYFETCFADDHTVLLAEMEGRNVGVGILNWKPRYSLYKRLGIPEIQDLNVIPDARRNGVATFMVEWCEDAARAKGKDMIGIGVGLTRDYGPAQILYARLGFIPDGYGVTYDRVGVTPHDSYRMDDDLSLMLVKSL